jgi:hypothetical protein
LNERESEKRGAFCESAQVNETKKSATVRRFEDKKNKGNCPPVAAGSGKTFLHFPLIIEVKMWTRNSLCGRANSLF